MFEVNLPVAESNEGKPAHACVVSAKRRYVHT
jgi:hypothetical protein